MGPGLVPPGRRLRVPASPTNAQAAGPRGAVPAGLWVLLVWLWGPGHVARCPGSPAELAEGRVLRASPGVRVCPRVHTAAATKRGHLRAPPPPPTRAHLHCCPRARTSAAALPAWSAARMTDKSESGGSFSLGRCWRGRSPASDGAPGWRACCLLAAGPSSSSLGPGSLVPEMSLKSKLGVVCLCSMDTCPEMEPRRTPSRLCVQAGQKPAGQPAVPRSPAADSEARALACPGALRGRARQWLLGHREAWGRLGSDAVGP